MGFKHYVQRTLLASCAVLACSQAAAGIVITGTRLVYPAGEKEITVKLNNNGTQPALIQAWVDTGDVESTPTSSDAPFILSPPVSRVDPSKGQSLRLMFTGAALPQDRESVFWFNVLEIPPKPQAGMALNTLQMAFRSRIKIFYRPDDLPGTPTEAIEQVRWSVVPAKDGQGFVLQASNPSAFHVSLVKLFLSVGTEQHPGEDGMVAPGETQRFALPTLQSSPPAGARVEFTAINDYGALISIKQSITP